MQVDKARSPSSRTHLRPALPNNYSIFRSELRLQPKSYLKIVKQSRDNPVTWPSGASSVQCLPFCTTKQTLTITDGTISCYSRVEPAARYRIYALMCVCPQPWSGDHISCLLGTLLEGHAFAAKMKPCSETARAGVLKLLQLCMCWESRSGKQAYYEALQHGQAS